MAVAMNLG